MTADVHRAFTRTRRHPVRRAAALLAVGMIAAGLGFGATLATAAATPRPAVFLAVGLLTTAAVTAAGSARTAPGRAVAAASPARLRSPRHSPCWLRCATPGRSRARTRRSGSCRPALGWPIWICRPPVVPD